MNGSEGLVLNLEGFSEDVERIFRGFDTMFSNAPYQRDFCIAKQRFTVRASHDAYVSQADRALASTTVYGPPSAYIAVGVGGEMGFPKLRWSGRYFEERKVEAMLAKSRYRLHYFPDKSFWQIFDRETNRGLQVMQSAAGYPDWDSGSPLRNFLQWHLAKGGGAMVHAGTLAVGGEGVLLAGAGGSGKSGTVLSGLLSGLQTVGDDYVFVDPKTMKAYPLFDTLKQDPKGLERLKLDRVAAIPKQLNWQNKHQFYLSDLNFARPDHIQLRALLLPKINGAVRSALTPASSKEAFLALAPSGVSQIPCDRPMLYSVAAEVSRGLPCYWLQLGPDPAEVAQTICQFLTEA